MKNIISKSIRGLLLACTLIVGIYSEINAQTGQSAKEKIESMRVAFITNKIDLSADEAKTLWPIYNEYQSEMQKLREKNDLSDIDRQEAELGIKKHYNDKFNKVIPGKLKDFYNADKEFKRMLIEKMTNGNRP